MQDYNRTPDEYGKRPPEESSPREWRPMRENQTPAETPPPAPESNASAGRRPEKKKREPSRLLATLVAATVATVSVGSALPSVEETFLPTAAAEVVEFSYGTTSDSLHYSLAVETDMPLDILLYNDFTNRRADLEDGNNRGVFEELTPGMRYTLAVVGESFFGEKEIFSRSVTLSPHPIEGSFAVITECGVDLSSFYYFVSTEGEEPLRAVLSGGDFYAEAPLVPGENEGGFEGLPLDTAFTFSIVGEGPLGDCVLEERQLETEHPIAFVWAGLDAVADGEAIYYTATAESYVPLSELSLWVTFSDAAGREISRLPFADTETDGSDPALGEMYGSFEGIAESGNYTVSVVGLGNNGEEVLTESAVRFPTPAELTSASLTLSYLESSGIQYEVTTWSELPYSELGIEIVLADASGAEITRAAFDPTAGDGPDDPLNATAYGTFADILLGETYTVSVVMPSDAGTLLLAEDQIAIPAV